MMPDIQSLTDVAFLTIFIAASIDAFFLTGLVFYGVILIGTAITLHAMGEISTFGLFMAAFLGSTLGSIVNFYIGYFFGHARIVKRFTDGDKISVVKKRLAQDGLFWTMVFGKFIAIFRPLYALILGILHTDQKRFLIYEVLIALFWTSFWLLILLFGEGVFFMIKE